MARGHSSLQGQHRGQLAQANRADQRSRHIRARLRQITKQSHLSSGKLFVHFTSIPQIYSFFLCFCCCCCCLAFEKTLNDIIRLRVPPYEDDEREKKYTYSQVIELNDKLTLVVGNREDQQRIIRCFSDVKLILRFEMS